MKIAVIGLGYVGLPLALALSKKNTLVGFDIDDSRVIELKKGFDRTGMFDQVQLKNFKANVTSQKSDISNSNIFIITVPTPVDENKNPDLSALNSASRIVGQFLEKDDIVVYESTVWPGVTEQICGPILENISGLKCGYDFFLGYSPERINPGDKEHTLENITKVVSGQNTMVTKTLTALYEEVTNGGIHVAPNIRTAEAAKSIENAQRDINIAFINEIAQICHKLDISTHDVLEAAETKWNFLKFRPGLVGGHCIGVDPYYLAKRARDLGHEPHILLTGRKINDEMGSYIATSILNQLNKNSKILVLGLTFKEDVKDLRNSQINEIIDKFKKSGHSVCVHDPHASPSEAKNLYDIQLESSLNLSEEFDCILCCVAHTEYCSMNASSISRLLSNNALLADIKGIWRKLEIDKPHRKWTL